MKTQNSFKSRRRLRRRINFLSMLNTLTLEGCFMILNEVHLKYAFLPQHVEDNTLYVTSCYQNVPLHTSDQNKSWFQQTTALNQSLLSTTLLAIIGYEPNSLIVSPFYILPLLFTDQLTVNSMRMGFSSSLPRIWLNVYLHNFGTCVHYKGLQYRLNLCACLT